MPTYEDIFHASLLKHQREVEELIQQVRGRSEDVNFIFMVGSVWESQYLKNDIKKHLQTFQSKNKSEKITFFEFICFQRAF